MHMREGMYLELERRESEYTTNIQSLKETDAKLAESDITPETIGLVTPKELGELLGCDAVVDGSIIKFDEKGKTGQVITSLLFGSATGSEVVCRIRITDCKTGNLLWDWEIKEKGGLFASPESVANKVGKKVAKKWPYKKRKS